MLPTGPALVSGWRFLVVTVARDEQLEPTETTIRAQAQI